MIKKNLYILICFIFLASCKTSYVKRHYRHGFYKETLSASIGLNQKSKVTHLFKQSLQFSENLNSNHHSNKIDSAGNDTSPDKLTKFPNSKNYLVKNQKRKSSCTLDDFEKKSEFKKTKTKKVKSSINFNVLDPLTITLFLLIGILAILFFLYLVSNFSPSFGVVLLVYFLLLVLAGIIFLVLFIIDQIADERKSKQNEIEKVGDKQLWRFRNNISKLRYLNWLALVFLVVGTLLIFIFPHSAILPLGIIFSISAFVRMFSMISAYTKAKSLLNTDEVNEYKKTIKLSCLLAIIFILSILVATFVVF